MGKKLDDLLEEEKTKLEDSLVETSETVVAEAAKTEEGAEAEEIESVVTAEDFDVSADIEAIFKDVDISEDFKQKAARVYEASVIALANSVVEKVAAQLQENFEVEYNGYVEAYEAELNEQIDGFVNVTVENWLKENAIPAVNTVRAEVAESLLDGLKDLLESHYVEVPEEKVDLVAAMEAKIAELEDGQSKLLEQVVDLKKGNADLVKAQLVKESAAGLTDVEADKFSKLSEAIDFSNASEFKSRLSEIRESYFSASIVETKSQFEEEEAIETITEEVEVKPTSSFNLGPVLSHLNKTRRSAK